MKLTKFRLAAILAGFVLTAPADAGLIGYYTFEGNANDVSGNGNHGVLSATAPTLTGAGGGFTGWGNPNSNAYSFGAGNTFITVPVNINPDAMPQVTFGAWVQASDLSDIIRGIISHDNVDFDRTLDIDVRNAGGSAEWCMFTGTGVNCAGSVSNSWTLLVARYDAATGVGQLTVNSTHSAQFAATPGLGLTNTTIGRNPTFDSPFAGKIDNVFFFNEYLSNAAVDNIHRNGISVSAVPEPSTLVLCAAGAALFLCGRLGRNRLR